MSMQFCQLPGDLKECELCVCTIRQCEMRTSCVPCACSAYAKHLKFVKSLSSDKDAR